MKEIDISLETVREKFTGETALKDLFVSIEKELQDEGFVVCQYVLNGMNLTEDDEQRLGVSKLGEVRELKVKYETPAALFGEILKGWVEEIPGLIKQADELAAAARAQELDTKMPRFIRFVENAQLLVESLISVRAVVNLERFGVLPEWEKVEREFNVAIGEALDGFQAKDMNLLADVLEYDTADGLQKWFDLLNRIDGSLKDDANSGDPIQLFRTPPGAEADPAGGESPAGTLAGDDPGT